MHKNDEQLTENVEKIANIYHQLTEDLFRRTVARLRQRGASDLEKTPYIWQLEKLNDMHMLNDEIVSTIAKYSNIAEDLLRDVIANEGFKVYSDTKQQLAEDLQKEVLNSDYQVHQALEAYVNQAKDDLSNLTNSTLPKSVRDVYAGIVNQTIAEGATGIKSFNAVFNDTVMRFHDKGFYGFTDRAGKRWKADVYARTLIPIGLNQSTLFEVNSLPLK